MKVQTAKQQNLFHAADLKRLGVDATEKCSANPLELSTQNFRNFRTAGGTTTFREAECLEMLMHFMRKIAIFQPPSFEQYVFFH